MICNSTLTIYHKTIDETTKLEKWNRQNYGKDESDKKVWVFGGIGSSINKGYENANDIDVRIPYSINDVNLDLIKRGDIIVVGYIDKDITTQQDLLTDTEGKDTNYEIYNITSINNNNFGKNPHLHLGGK